MQIFEDLKREYASRVNERYSSPLIRLQDHIPKSTSLLKPLVYPIDPDLDMQEGNETAWASFHQEGLKLMVTFNEKLRDAIMHKCAPMHVLYLSAPQDDPDEDRLK